jgi:hypothetical protein
VILARKKITLKILSSLAPSIHLLSDTTPLEEALAYTRKLQEEETSVCLVLNSPYIAEKTKRRFAFFSFQEKSFCLIKTRTQDFETVITAEKIDFS